LKPSAASNRDIDRECGPYVDRACKVDLDCVCKLDVDRASNALSVARKRDASAMRRNRLPSGAHRS
jgi:hypothetical protein